MNINNNVLNFIDILGDLEEISKILYLESPELWIDFSDKINNKIIDEMVLFHAAKYNYVSVIKFVSENNIFNLDSPSRNKSFPTIKLHLIAAASEFNSIEVYNYLVKGENKHNKNNSQNLNKKEVINKDEHYPIYNCPTCKENIFNKGYKIIEEIYFNYDPKINNFQEISKQKIKHIFCGNCNNIIENISVESLEKMCSINNCRNCGKDLTKSGIEQKIKMKLNPKNNTFISSDKTYVCSSCQETLNEVQIKTFKL